MCAPPHFYIHACAAAGSVFMDLGQRQEKSRVQTFIQTKNVNGDNQDFLGGYFFLALSHGHYYDFYAVLSF